MKDGKIQNILKYPYLIYILYKYYILLPYSILQYPYPTYYNRIQTYIRKSSIPSPSLVETTLKRPTKLHCSVELALDSCIA